MNVNWTQGEKNWHGVSDRIWWQRAHGVYRQVCLREQSILTPLHRPVPRKWLQLWHYHSPQRAGLIARAPPLVHANYKFEIGAW